MSITKKEFQYMKEGISSDIAEYLIKDLNITFPEALDIIYNSDLYTKLSDPKTGLYYQGSRYVYTFLEHELRYGIVG